MTTNELREKRASLVKTMQDFLTARSENNDGVLSAEDAASYEKMENDLSAMTDQVKRMERMDVVNAELNKPTSKPLTDKPMSKEAKDSKKTGRGSDEYTNGFWNMMRSRVISPAVMDALQIGTDTEGGYLVPDEFEKTLVEALEAENIMRKLAHTIQTSSGDRQIPVVSTKGTASWVAEEGAIQESDPAFGQVTLGAHKLGTMVKVSNELLNDSVFDLEAYISKEFGRRIGAEEESAFFTGNGSGKPTGIMNATGGADVGVTTAAADKITADEIIDLYYALGAPYRKNAVWVFNDATIKVVRKLKDGNGNYLWSPALTDKAPDTLLGRPVYTTTALATIAAGAKVGAFGDFGYYWIADRQGRNFRKLSELYAVNDQTAFIATERVDGKLILSEAIKALKMHA